MDHTQASGLIAELLVVLAAGLVAGILCKRYRVSLLVGYLIVGSLIGAGGLHLLGQQRHEMEQLAETGAFFLLFAVGIEFSLEELAKLARFMLTGGAAQMALVAIPLTLVAHAMGLSWPGAILAGTAGALSSTVLVFGALRELGQTRTPHGRRGLAVLLFQDVALVPLLLLVPLLTGSGPKPTAMSYVLLALRSSLFVSGVIVLRAMVRRFLVPMLTRLRAVEIVVLFSLCMLGGVCWVAYLLGLPPAVGALASGLALSGNRLSRQIDSILLPFRETFSAVFFVTLGMLLQPGLFLKEPILLTAGLLGILFLKTLAATVAMRLTGLPWKAALGMGAGLSQLGEFSFLLVAQGMSQNLISATDYNRMLFIALGSLILTPFLLRWGLALANQVDHSDEVALSALPIDAEEHRAVVIGIGPIGRQVSSRLETMGMEVTLIDLSTVNLQPFAQLGFATYAGDARDVTLLERAKVRRCFLAVVCVPSDEIAEQIVRTLRNLHTELNIVVRCRLEAHIPKLRQAGADKVVSEEAEATNPIIQICEEMTRYTSLVAN